MPPAHCPRCGNALAWMTARRLGAHVCPACHGMWVERGAWDALVRLTERSGRAGLPAPETREPVTGLPPVRCLVCGATCARILSWTGGVEVDLCGPHGLWFDRDELHTVLHDVARSTRQARLREENTSEATSLDASDAGVCESFIELAGGGGEGGASYASHEHTHASHHDSSSSNTSSDTGSSGGSTDFGGGHHHH